MAIVRYCAAADVSKVLSAAGVSLRVDDGDATVLDAIDEASVEVDGFALLLYSQTALLASQWVKKKCAWLAARFLCLRRGNAPSKAMAKECERIFDQLDEVRLGSLQIPDAPQRKAAAPVLSNQRVRLVPIPQAVTERGRSTGNPEGYPPHDDQYDPTDYTL